ncbi:RNA polymerase sigma factor [Enterococcus sp. BWR-S5]|uniref:RNA polymerase sigma factor n=1 Tax=Enterococcus sp. BWR-S5 TaxID=2787714 RepID=UPI0019250304|nr:sigma-70 family RNA polymerase sigma factor [Enterococcus sp. BWR-S5]MBL1224474.1 sigma-70 family RNA polymerase sigma factor [Enterococcus sp. BWR-S5]
MNEKEKFGLVFEQYYEELFRYAVYLTKNREQADDLVGNAVYKFLLNIEKISEEQQKFWLLRVIRNDFIDSERKRKRWKTDVFHRIKETLWNQEDTEQELINQESKERLASLIAALASPYKEVIFHYYYSEMSVKEIAHYFGMNNNQVKTILYRGRKKLKEVLLNEGFRRL